MSISQTITSDTNGCCNELIDPTFTAHGSLDLTEYTSALSLSKQQLRPCLDWFSTPSLIHLIVLRLSERLDDTVLEQGGHALWEPERRVSVLGNSVVGAVWIVSCW